MDMTLEIPSSPNQDAFFFLIGKIREYMNLK